ncbi:MAG: SurA N-terminal domain-containing protein, partial [Candidatus Zophobacter franzmannii]|nr:SurA N-terminal domain-containing protein [Candidatus Zophobacter franzmannii]
MKKILIVICILTINLVLFGEVIDRIVAKVGDEIILYSELIMQRDQMKEAGLMEESNSLQNVLNDMVESKLIIQKAKKLEYFVDQDRIIAMVDQRMAEIQKQFETTLEFNRWLSENNW